MRERARKTLLLVVLFLVKGLIVLTVILEPTSAPVDLFVEDKNDSSVTIIWSEPTNIGASGLDGYTIEICKDGSESWTVHSR